MGAQTTVHKDATAVQFRQQTPKSQSTKSKPNYHAMYKYCKPQVQAGQ